MGMSTVQLLVRGQAVRGRAHAPGVSSVAPRRPDELVDAHGRRVRELRVSVTDRCNFRCVYCMEPDARFLAGDRLLTPHEIERVARECVGLGVRKIRITGGEPTVREDLDEIIERLGAVGCVDLAMTSNGSLLTRERLRRWKRAGLGRLTLSIDAADAASFRRITRSDAGDVSGVVGAVEAAMAEGYEGTKLNAVLIRGVNEDQAAPLAGLARRLGVEVRFIEFMPLDGGMVWSRGSLVPAAEVHAAIDRVYPLVSVGREHRSSTAELYGFADGAPGRVGLIAPVTRPFCGACARLRIGADGAVRACLFGAPTGQLRDGLRSGADGAAIRREILEAVWRKQAGHGIGTSTFHRPDVAMNAIGG
jgi:cyclic pyranopterin phosphate synthase